MGLLVDETLTTSRVDGTRRWNLTLKEGVLHVSHRPGGVVVSQFHRAHLIVEGAAFPSELAEPTADVVELERRVRELRRRHLARPVAAALSRNVMDGPRVVYERRPDVKAWVLQEADGRCELCGHEAPFVGSDGAPYLEVHHVKQLAHAGPDTVENAVALCASCHRRLHQGNDQNEQRELLYRRVHRLTRPDG